MHRTRYAHRLASGLLMLVVSSALYPADIDTDVQVLSKPGTKFVYPTIVVDGDKGAYRSVKKDDLAYYVRVKRDFGSRFDNKVKEVFFEWFNFIVWSGQGSIAKVHLRYEADASGDWATYRLEFPYADPVLNGVENERVSPIELCNQRLGKLSGADRTQMLEHGKTFGYDDAFNFRAIYTISMDVRGRLLHDLRDITSNRSLPVYVRCRNLEGPRARRTKPTTVRGTGAPTTTEPPPVIQKVSLRAEPQAKLIAPVPGMLCPTTLRLYGDVTARRAFDGVAIFFGPAFLSPLTEVKLPKGGHRALVASYPLTWTASRNDLKAPDAPDKPLSRTVNVKLNIADEDGKVLASSGQETYVVTCKLAPTPPDPKFHVLTNLVLGQGGETTTPKIAYVAENSLPQQSDFDVRVRLVEPLGERAAKAWVYNKGPDVASGCRVTALVENDSAKRERSAELDEIELGETLPVDLDLGGPLSESDSVSVSVECAGEPAANRQNNREILKR